ncbi:FAD-binding oxidoreductase [Subtercola frigoramans]|uniref:FAD/FMN-containing dehydrogenase n=1 Tax=Subtercola frigoramans TaxID=120298 RepID=A0ABS2L7K0_9MICO|nr:FAD-binding oxidoreductase [Subtercola frigoramans]MBM7472441.1 FAD/FMN-containing dehydrogenase [Subtercola frigoramans]
MGALDALTGRVVLPSDDEYETVRASWNLLFSHRPAAIVYVHDTGDVVNAVVIARHNDIPLRVRSGGHCLEGWSTLDDGLVIDVSGLTSVSVDTESRTATVGAGLTQAQAVAALGAAGFAAPTGTEGTVSLAGATLGGGFGLLTRVFGMACDNLLAVEIVVASVDGGAEVLTVDADNNAELLWALRGAGNGSFGVVTALTYAVHPLADVCSVTATWPGLEALPDVFATWQATAPVANERLTSQLEITRDSMVLFAVLVPTVTAQSEASDHSAYADSPNANETGAEAKAEAERMLAPLLAIASPEVVVTHASWPETYSGFQIATAEEPANWKFTSQFVSEPFPAEAIDIIVRFMALAPTEHCNYFTNAFGGAVAHSEPTGGSAFAHRNALFYAEPGAGWGARGGVMAAEDPLTSQCLRWVADFAEAMEPFVNGAYPNVPNADAADWLTEYWGLGVPRLRTVKSAYDPSDVFSFAQSVPPS